MACKPKNNTAKSEEKKTIKEDKGVALEAKTETMKTTKTSKIKVAEEISVPIETKKATKTKDSVVKNDSVSEKLDTKKEVKGEIIAKAEEKTPASKSSKKAVKSTEKVIETQVVEEVKAPEAKSKTKEIKTEEPVEVIVKEEKKDSPEKTPKASKKVAKKVEEEIVKEPINENSEISVQYSEEDLAMFYKVISEAKNEAIEELTVLKERLDDLNSYEFAEESMIYSMHMAEQGSEAQEKEKTYAQIQRMTDHLRKLDEALIRIENKTYGICRVCNCLIAKERLLAVPITTLSASYKIHKRCPEDGIDRIEPAGGQGK